MPVKAADFESATSTSFVRGPFTFTSRSGLALSASLRTRLIPERDMEGRTLSGWRSAVMIIFLLSLAAGVVVVVLVKLLGFGLRAGVIPATIVFLAVLV